MEISKQLKLLEELQKPKSSKIQMRKKSPGCLIVKQKALKIMSLRQCYRALKEKKSHLHSFNKFPRGLTPQHLKLEHAFLGCTHTQRVIS